MSTTTTPSLSLSNFKPRYQNPVKTHHLSPLSWSFNRQASPSSLVLRHNHHHQEKKQLWRFSATPEDISQEIVASDPSSTTEAIVSTDQDGIALVIQVLLITAFLALTVLTIGVVYIGVTEFLGKREREKFEREEAAKKSKKSGKKKATRAKAGPRGFGQKIEDDDFDFDLD